MKKALLVALILVAASAAVMAQVNVTFIVNTASVSDTISGTSTMRVSGDFTGWGDGSLLTNIGGDYWKGTFPVTANSTIHYKYRLNGGWENNLSNASTNRENAIGSTDTTLNLVFYNTGPTADQNWRPWGTVSDTMRVVYFRVNMLGYQSGSFVIGTDSVGVRGDQKTGPGWSVPSFQWGTTHFLTREATAGMGGYIWSGAVLFPKSKAPAGDTGGYKFIIDADWGRADGNNRFFTIPNSAAETTLAWVWFNNDAPIIRNNADTVTVTFIANMTTAINKQSFVTGDTLQVQVGWFGTADSTYTIQMVKQGGTQNYAAQKTFISKLGAYLDYQYYLQKNGSSNREYYFNFDWVGVTPSEQERRQIMLTTKTQTVTDNVVSVNNSRRQPYFQNMTRLSQSVTVKWEVDIRPAYYAIKAGKTLHDGQGTTIDIVSTDTVKAWGVIINGPAFGNWAAWGRARSTDSVNQMWDDGTHGDAVVGDSIFTQTRVYDTTYTKGQVFKFGIGGGDNESGFGLNHIDNISDASPTYTLREQFGSINPSFYSSWDFTNERPAGATAVTGSQQPTEFSLLQNYPNPFNPSTKIEFALPTQAHVSLKVYNMLGQVVATVVNGVMNAGAHSVTFDASKLSSGVYFYRIDAGNFSSIKKMVLVK